MLPSSQELVPAIHLGQQHYLRLFPVWFAFRGNYGTLLSQAKALSTAGHLAYAAGGVFPEAAEVLERITPGSELEPGSVEISAQSEETGSNETVVDATIEGPSVLIAFNVRFLREVLDVVGTPNVALETTAAAAPGLIRPLGEDNFLHVIMPMHLGN